jgi:hypothetical protein
MLLNGHLSLPARNGIATASTLTENPGNDNTPNARGMEKVSRTGRSTIAGPFAESFCVRADTPCARRHAAVCAVRS